MSAPAPASAAAAHQLAATAQAGFTDASSYDAHRPSYPAASVERLLRSLKVEGVEGARVVELAAGTGKFTELLAARPERYEVVAVEPHADMIAQLRKKAEAAAAAAAASSSSSGDWANVRVEEGVATDMAKVPDQWADAVIVAQAFHWFATMPALREIHRVMAPGAVLGLIWNIEDYNSARDWEVGTPYEQKLNDLIWSLDDDDLRYRHNAWKKVFDDQLKSDPVSIHAADPLFSLPLGEDVNNWTIWLTKEAAWNRFSTISHVANLRGEQAEKAKKTAFAALDEAPTNEKGEVAIHGNTFAFWTTAIPGDTLKSGG